MLLADTLVHENPTAAQLADIAVEAAAKARDLGLEPRVALLSYSNFGNPMADGGARVREAVALLDTRKVDFEYDGEMSADVALDRGLMRRLYPFCRLSGPANILVMPDLHSGNIAAKLLAASWRRHRDRAAADRASPSPVQIVNIGATVSDLVNLAALAAHDAIR